MYYRGPYKREALRRLLSLLPRRDRSSHLLVTQGKDWFRKQNLSPGTLQSWQVSLGFP